MNESRIDTESDECVEEIDDLCQSVAECDRMAQVGAEVFAGDAVQLSHEEQSLRTDEVWRRIPPAVATSVRTSNVLEHSAKQVPVQYQ